MKYLKTIYLLLCCTLALAACSDDDENSASGALSITTPDSVTARHPIRTFMTRPPKSEDRKSVRP